MTYHPLSNDTGGSADDRRAEASRILSILVNSGLDVDSLPERQANFIRQMLDDETVPISPKQLFWLRDIKDSVI
jgi:hypothetical protein